MRARRAAGISGHLSDVTVNGIDVTEFVSAELDRQHPERVQFRRSQTAGEEWSDRMAVIRRIVTGLADADLGGPASARRLPVTRTKSAP